MAIKKRPIEMEGGSTSTAKPQTVPPEESPKVEVPTVPQSSAGSQGGNTATAPKKEEVKPFSYADFSYAGYEKSDAVKQAEALLNQHVAGKPGAYSPVWQDEADAYLSQYQSRDPFAYDFNADALYQQYKDQYIQQGQMAMMDTMGQAAAMTGGYGNSYAQTVGQQAFNQYLAQLHSVMPELYGMAYDRYTQEGQDLLDQYDLYMDREAQEYSRYQDSLDNWYRETQRLTDNYDTEYARDREDYEAKKAIAYDEHLADREQAYNEYLSTYTGTDTGDGPTFEKLETGSNAYNTIIRAINGAKSLDELDSITQEFTWTYGKDAIKRLGAFKTKLAELTPKPGYSGVGNGGR